MNVRRDVPFPAPLPAIAAGLAVAIAVAATPPARADEPPGVPGNTLYVTAVSHLDTEWWWTVAETIRDLIPATFRDNMDLMDRHPGFRFGWEGAHRYALLREYHPDLWERLKTYVADGRWSPAGSALEGGDVNIPSPESLVRQFLYGNGFFRRELGVASVDVFLPDCFGFGWALPSVAAHCGLVGFSTQKLTWGSAIGIPFDVGRWRGPDGAEIVAALRPGNYVTDLSGDWSRARNWLDALDRQQAVSGMRFGYAYFGVGDRGGGVGEASVANLEANIAGDGPVRLRSVPPDRFFRDLTASQIAALPVHDGELVLSTHGTGSYTSQCAMKRWNRRNEQLGDSAERAAVVASWLGALPYPGAWLADAWIRFLVHQFHDDLTGTSIPEVYLDSWNDERLAQLRFATVLSAAAGGAARAMDTTAQGVPLVVWNPLAIARQDVVEATVRFPDAIPPHVRVFGPDGSEVPAQVLGLDGSAVRIAFVAGAPATGFATYDARPSDVPCTLPTGLSASATGLANGRYRVSIDANGDVSSIVDTAAAGELLSGPVRLALFNDVSITYPAWEIPWYDLEDGPREHVDTVPSIEVVESGPARVAVEIRREHATEVGTSSYVLRVSLAADGAGSRVSWDASIDWHNRVSLLKVEFPLANSAPGATYDLGLGAIRRPDATPLLYEVPAQQWADVTAVDGSAGASVLTQDKVGWHKPDEGTLYLTLIHTSMLPDFHHDTNDLGRHRTGWAMTGHVGDWTNGIVDEAARYNQPLLAFQSPAHAGTRGRTWSFAGTSDPAVAIRALKQAEESDEVVVRVQETGGRAKAGVRVSIGDGIAEAREVRGDEQPLGPSTLADGAILTDLGPFQPRTFAVRLAPAGNPLAPAVSRPIDLPFDTDVLSSNDARGDGAFDTDLQIAWAAEQWPATLSVGGVGFVLGSAADGHANAVTCRGQAIPIDPAEGERLHLLAASVGDVDATFRMGSVSGTLAIQDHSGFIGQWDSRVVDGGFVDDPMPALPGYLKPAEPAWYGTHRHLPGGDDVHEYSYLFHHALDVPAGAKTLVLPDDPRVKILAVTLADDPNGATVPASEMLDDLDPLQRPLPGWVAPPLPPEPVPDEAEAGETALPDEADAATDTPAADEGPADDGRDAGTLDAGPETADASPDPGGPDPRPAGGGSSGCSAGGTRTPTPFTMLPFAMLAGLATVRTFCRGTRRRRNASRGL